jgi:DNA-binding helix-hairpin-helix protein with protein kinase domain
VTTQTTPPEVTSLRLANRGPFRVIDSRIAVGGEGAIYKMAEPAGQVLKHYLPQVLARKGDMLAAKVQAMVDNPPDDPTASQGHVSLAWPQALVLDRGGHFAGYLMAWIDTASSVELHMVSNPADRKRGPKTPPWVGGFTWEYLLRVATNLASATQALHDAGYVIGDFNERNVLVRNNALVTLVDCDSMQVPGPSGTSFLCEVFRPEFTAPELLHADLSQQMRTPESDRFALAVHIYQLLMEGRHPFAGMWLHGAGDKPERHKLAELGLFVQKGDKRLTPQAGTPPFGIFTDDVRRLFLRAFVDGAKDPTARPSGLEWYHVLQGLATTLKKCQARPSHRYPGHLGIKCPWCELEKASQVAPVPATRQVSLPPALAPKRQASPPHQAPVWNRPPPAPPPVQPSWPTPLPGGWNQGWIPPANQQVTPPLGVNGPSPINGLPLWLFSVFPALRWILPLLNPQWTLPAGLKPRPGFMTRLRRTVLVTIRVGCVIWIFGALSAMADPTLPLGGRLSSVITLIPAAYVLFSRRVARWLRGG